MSELSARVAAALSRIQNPRLENDLLSSGMVRDLVVEDNGKVSFTFLLGREDPATPVREARGALPAAPPPAPPGWRARGRRIAAPAAGQRLPQPRQDHRDLLGEGRGGQVHS